MKSTGVGISGWLMFCSAAVGVVASLWLTHRLIQWLSTSSFFAEARRSPATSITAYIFAVVSLPFALYLGVTVGGTLGGGWGDQLVGSAGTVIGLGIGLFGVTMLITGVAAVAGSLLGNLITKVLPSQRP